MRLFCNRIFRHTSIQTRLIVSFIILSIIPLGSMGYLAYALSSNAVENKIKTYSAELMKGAGDYVNVQIARIIDTNNDIILSQTIQKELASLPNLNSFERLQAIKTIEQFFLNVYAKTNDIICSLIVTDKDEKFVYSQAHLLSQEDINMIKDMVEQYMEENSDNSSLCTGWKINERNAVLIARNVPNVHKGSNMGYIITIVDERYLSSGYKDINLGEGSELFIIDKYGQIISSLNSDEIGNKTLDSQYLNAVIQSAEDKSAFNLENALVASSYMKKSGWYLVSKIPYSYLFHESNTIRNFIILFVASGLILSFIAVYLISKSISNPLKDLMKNMEKAKEGDLTIQIEDKNRDELGAVARYFNDMLSNINFLVAKVHSTAQEVINSSNSIASSAEQSLNFSEQIALAIHQIAQGSSHQAADTIDSVENMNLLSNDITNVGDFMIKASDVLKNAKEVNFKIQGDVSQLNQKAQDTSRVSDAIVEDIYELNQDINEIGNIIKLIFTIAEQTNLLSLNAAIEAARAGEAGRGFAVVAEEVKKLATQSKDASITINSIVNKIQNKARATVNQASDASRIVKEQMDAVNTTDHSFKEVFESMDSIFSIMNEMKESVNKALKSKQKTTEALENIAAISEEAAASAEEVSSSTQEQIVSFKKLTEISNNINDLAIELDKMISIFKI